MNENRYEYLAAKWFNKTITAEERTEFSTWYNQNLDDEIWVAEGLASSEEDHKQRILNRINHSIDKNVQIRMRLYLKQIAAAAAILLFLSIGIFMATQRTTHADKQLALQNAPVPGRNKAVLILANGKEISLDNEEGSGLIATESGVSITKTGDGQIKYTIKEAEGNSSSENEMNTIKTPNGGQYQVVLPDGSTVWLNASSALTYATGFDNQERRVKLDGEAYFEIKTRKYIALNSRGAQVEKKVPFIVETLNQEVAVLGTQFNINTYVNEKTVKTTLVEGAVRIQRTGSSKTILLKPGEQAALDPSNESIQVAKVDVSEFVDWKDGYFHFSNADIYTIMRQFSRWYDVEVSFKSKQYTDVFAGKIPRSTGLKKALEILGKTGVKFKIEGKKLIVQ